MKSWLVAATLLACASPALPQTPLTGHYPPGQSGIRGASTPAPGISITNFNRFFTNLDVVDSGGNSTQDLDELRYGNITMITWTTEWNLLGMRYGALAGIPFATGDLTAPSDEHKSFGLGDVLITPVSLYGKSDEFDYQFQFTLWTASGRFSPGAPDNRGTGFWSLVYSLGGVYYPGGSRDEWSVSAVARIEQNFEQRDSNIRPGDDIVVDWGAGHVLHAGARAIDAGISGYGAWQLTMQEGGPIDATAHRYRYFGIGPEASMSLSEPLSLRLRAHWEFAPRSVVSGNNLWVILNYRW